jgi:soluble lytic murein transglycosylase-like protein
MDTLLVATFISVSAQFNLPPDLLSSICYVESKHDAFAVHHDDGGSDSLGVCEIKYETAKWLGFKGDAPELMNPRQNIYYAGKYLRYQLDRYNWNIPKAVISYNQGRAGDLTHTEYSVRVLKQWRTKQ